MMRRVTLAVILGAAVLGASACGSSSGGQTGGGGQAGGGGQTTGGATNSSGPSIGVAEINLSLPFFVQMKAASDKIAQNYGVNDVWQSADGSVEKEISIVQNYIQQRKKVIMIDPLDAKALVPVVNQATKAGIKVITMGNKVAGNGNYNTLYPDAANWVMNAKILGTALHGKGTVLFLIGSVGNYVSDTRQQAFESTMKSEFPGIKVITEPTNFDSSTAASVTNTVLTNNPDLAGVASISDGLTLPALKVLQAKGKLGIPFVTNDGDPDVYPYIEKGQVLDDVLTGSYRVGAWNTAVAARLAKGASFKKDLFMPTYFVCSDKLKSTLQGSNVNPGCISTSDAVAKAKDYMKEFGPSQPNKAMTVQ